MSGYGFHWTPCSKGPGIGAVVGLVAVVLIVSHRQAVETGLTDLLEIALAVTGGLAAIGTTVAVLVFRSHRRNVRDDRRVLTAVPVRPGLPDASTAALEDRTANRPALSRGHASRDDVDTRVVTSRVTCPNRSRRTGRRS